eukprot:TRINITY_DN17506_c0_g1_i1.p2 TRINITY_DN17506_c0_g1~~TRINITY_DN17506_c0_g1_i1.p2  ORF type:complete len:146 (+),score=23.10 TRINITY_DN17506_c0_g1_i1:168-605(+)
MRFFKKIAGFLGLSRDENHQSNDEEDEDSGDRADREGTGRPTKGFSVQVPVVVEKVHQGPILVPCNFGEGGVQGLRWYARCLKIDEDGDIANEFLDEIFPVASRTEDRTGISRFGVKSRTQPARVRSPVIKDNGNIHLRGRLLHA